MKRWTLALLLTVFCLPAFSAGQIARVEILDVASGRTLPVYHSGGRYYVAGTPGREYSIRLRNRAYDELLAVVSVDGVNVVTGETAALGQGGYIALSDRFPVSVPGIFTLINRWFFDHIK